MPTTCLQYKGIDYMSTVQRHWLQHVYSTKAFSWRQKHFQTSTDFNNHPLILTGFTQPKGSCNKEGGPLQTTFWVWISTNLSSTFGCSSCIMLFQVFQHLDSGSSGIIGPLGIALDCRPGSNVIAPSHPYIQQVHARRPQWMNGFHPTHPTKFYVHL